MSFDHEEAKRLQDERKERQERFAAWLRDLGISFEINGTRYTFDPYDIPAQVLRDIVHEDIDGLANMLEKVTEDKQKLAELSAYLIRLLVEALVSPRSLVSDWQRPPYISLDQYMYMWVPKTDN